MLTEKEITDINETLSEMDNRELTLTIAYMHWVETTDPTFWQNELGDEYSPQKVTDIKSFLWNEATKRGISVEEVRAAIRVMAQETLEENREQIKRSKLKSLLIKKEKTSKIVKNIILAIIIVVVLFLIYKYVFKGKLNF